MKDNSSLFMEVIGISDESKVLDYFMCWRDFNVTIKDIRYGIRCDGNSTKNLNKVIKKFVDMKILVKVGRDKFKLNKKNFLVISLLNTFDIIIKQELTKVTKKK